MKALVLRLMLAVAATLGNPAAAGEASDAIHAGSPEFIVAFNSGDSARLASFYTTSTQLLPPGPEFIQGREAIAAFWQSAMDIGLKLTGLEPLEIVQAGDIATDVDVLHLSAPDGEGGTVALSDKYIVI